MEKIKWLINTDAGLIPCEGILSSGELSVQTLLSCSTTSVSDQKRWLGLFALTSTTAIVLLKWTE